MANIYSKNIIVLMWPIILPFSWVSCGCLLMSLHGHFIVKVSYLVIYGIGLNEFDWHKDPINYLKGHFQKNEVALYKLKITSIYA